MFENKNIKKLKPYKTSSHEAWEFEGSEILKLDWNESTIPPSEYVMNYIKEEIEKGKINWYPDTDNILLRHKIADYASVNVENVEYFASSDSLHEYIFQCYSKEDTKLLRLTPTYDNFRAVADSYGVKIIDLDINHIQNDISKLNHEIHEIKPSMVYICNPNNPTGHVFKKEDLYELINSYQNVLFIIDEAYFEFEGTTIAEKAHALDNAIICRTFSKAFGIASFRVGYAISSSYNIKTLKKVRNAKNIPALSQHAAIASLNDTNYMQKYVNEVITAKRDFYNFLDECCFIKKYFKGAGNYILFELEDGIQEDFIMYLKERMVFIRAFKHIPNHARITIGTLKQMEIIKDLYRKYKS